jgi:hypothetical protein
MVRILKAELNYNKKLIIGFFSLLPVTWLLALYGLEELPPGYLMFWLMFIMLQSWNSFRNKERREYQVATLPLSNWNIAMARMMMVVFLSIAMMGIYYLILFTIQPQRYSSFFGLFLPFAILILMFSLYFLLRDLLLYFMRNNKIYKITKDRSVTILMLLVFLGVVLNFLAFLVRPSGLRTVINFVIAINPFRGEYGLIKLYFLSFVLAGLTLITFNRRNSYLE